MEIFVERIIMALIFIGIIIFIALDIKDFYNLVSISGLAAFILVAVLLSSNRSYVKILLLY